MSTEQQPLNQNRYSGKKNEKHQTGPLIVVQRTPTTKPVCREGYFLLPFNE
jgi:hypothetical protein